LNPIEFCQESGKAIATMTGVAPDVCDLIGPDHRAAGVRSGVIRLHPAAPGILRERMIDLLCLVMSLAVAGAMAGITVAAADISSIASGSIAKIRLQ
jgi:hypothetical protein